MLFVKLSGMIQNKSRAGRRHAFLLWLSGFLLLLSVHLNAQDWNKVKYTEALGGNCKNGLGLVRVTTNNNSNPRWFLGWFNNGSFSHGFEFERVGYADLNENKNSMLSFANPVNVKSENLLLSYLKQLETNAESRLLPDSTLFASVSKGNFREKSRFKSFGTYYLSYTLEGNGSRISYYHYNGRKKSIEVGRFDDNKLVEGLRVDLSYNGNDRYEQEFAGGKLIRAINTVVSSDNSKVSGYRCSQDIKFPVHFRNRDFGSETGWILSNFEYTDKFQGKIKQTEPYFALFVDGEELSSGRMPAFEPRMCAPISINDTTTYTGEVDEKNLPSGFGILTIHKSSSYFVYQGFVRNSAPNGNGILWVGNAPEGPYYMAFAGYFIDGELVNGRALNYNTLVKVIAGGGPLNYNRNITCFGYNKDLALINGEAHIYRYQRGPDNKVVLWAENLFKYRDGKLVSGEIVHYEPAGPYVPPRNIINSRVDCRDLRYHDIVVVDHLASPVESFTQNNINIPDGVILLDGRHITFDAHPTVELSSLGIDRFITKCPSCFGSGETNFLHQDPPKEVTYRGYETRTSVGDYYEYTYTVPVEHTYMVQSPGYYLKEQCYNCHGSGNQIVQKQIRVD